MADEPTLEQKLAQLEAQNAASQAQIAKLQSERDKASDAARRARQVPPVPAAGATQQQQNDELMRFANDQAREAERLRTAIKFGIDPSDLEGDFSTPTELELAAQVKKLERDQKTLVDAANQTNQLLEQLRKNLEKPPEPGGGPEGADTGGPTGRVAKREKKVQQLREEAAKRPRTQQAVWLTLRAAHLDPNKIIVSGPQAEDEE